MGANCCVALKEKKLPNTTRLEVSAYRNVRHSPSWSFHWDNRTHIEDTMDHHSQCSHPNSENVDSESKSDLTAETEDHSGGGIPIHQAQKWRKSSMKSGHLGKHNFFNGDQTIGSGFLIQEKETAKSSFIASASNMKVASLMSPTQLPSAFRAESSYSSSQHLPCDPTSSQKACYSPVNQLFGQIPGSRITSLKSLNENNSPESRQSFMLSVCSNDTSGRSHAGSSDGWSKRTFTELVASSQRERWSFDSENFSSNNSRRRLSNSLHLTLSSPDLRTCRICSKLLKEISPWSSQKLTSTNDLTVVAILVCDHAYHAECLESMTPETDKYDPACPICLHGEKYVAKLFGKMETRSRNKLSRIAVADVNIDKDAFSYHQKGAKKGARMGASSSLKSALARPFLKRHFSIGQPSRSVLESESSRKRGFWARY